MPYLHPDKVVGVTRALLPNTQAAQPVQGGRAIAAANVVQQRPRRPQPSAERAAISAANQRAQRALPQRAPLATPGLLAQHAYELRAQREATLMNRMARRNKPEVLPGKRVGQSSSPPGQRVGQSRPAPGRAPTDMKRKPVYLFQFHA